MDKADGREDRYLSEEVKRRPRFCGCGPTGRSVEENREVFCLICGKPSPKTRRLQAA